MGLLAGHGGSIISVLGCATVFGLLGGTTAHLLQIQLPQWMAAVGASLVNPRQYGW